MDVCWFGCGWFRICVGLGFLGLLFGYSCWVLCFVWWLSCLLFMYMLMVCSLFVLLQNAVVICFGWWASSVDLIWLFISLEGVLLIVLLWGVFFCVCYTFCDCDL